MALNTEMTEKTVMTSWLYDIGGKRGYADTVVGIGEEEVEDRGLDEGEWFAVANKLDYTNRGRTTDLSWYLLIIILDGNMWLPVVVLFFIFINTVICYHLSTLH